jgi:hypothetical protein
MSSNQDYESIPTWVIWLGLSMMVFTILCFVLMTLGMIYV